MAYRFEDHLAHMQRRVFKGERDGAETAVVHAWRTYETDALDLWQALTRPERLERWFLPISGDLRLGGRYQFQGNAGGTIQECVEPELIKATWEFGGGVSWLTVRLVPQADGTRLELEHEAHPMPGFSEVYGPGAVGVGWDGGFYGLTLHLSDPDGSKPPEADATWPLSDEGRSFYRSTAEAWAEADIASGTPEAAARERAEATRRFYTGEGPGAAGPDAEAASGA